MHIKTFVVILIGLLTAFISCASSNAGKHYNGVYTAQEDKNYSIEKALFIFDNANLSEKYENEQFFSEQAVEFGIEVIPGEKLLPSLKKYTPEEIAKKAKDNNCDSLIIGSLQSSETLNQDYLMYAFGYGYPAIIVNESQTKLLLRFSLLEIPSNRIIAVTSVDINGESNRKLIRLAILRLLREYKYLGIIK